MGNAAIHFVAEGFDTRGSSKIKGRQAAGEGFLRGFARHADVPAFFCFARTQAEARKFAQLVSDAGPQRPSEVRFISAAEPMRLTQAGALFHPGPDLIPHAWSRRAGSQRGYSITGVTHTICSHGAMDSIGGLMGAPMQSWDALICTSSAVLTSVTHMLEREAEYVEARYGVRPKHRFQTPVIPLGVDCDQLGPTSENLNIGRKLRAKMGLADNDVAILFMGRLSYHAKANPLPMFLAAEAAHRATGRAITLLFGGQFPNDGIARDFKTAAATFAPSVRTLFVDGGNDTIRRNIWHAADIFCSPSDNIQETFGLTPIEAMAAGLAVLVSDWDGYKDTVRDEVDGFKIPTYMPGAGHGNALALRHQIGSDNYDHYIGYASQSIAVDVQAMTQAMIQLVASDDLRKKMGAAGAQKARESFDWSVVVKAHQDLWRELSERRAVDDETATRAETAPAHPLREDPFSVFANYPTEAISSEMRFLTTGEDNAFDTIRQSALMRFAAQTLLPPDAMRSLWQQPGKADMDDPVTVRSLGWLLKAGLLRVEDAPIDEDPDF